MDDTDCTCNSVHNFEFLLFRIAKRLGLKSKSFGKDDGRFITVSRKFDAAQIIEELIRRGGSNEKYILVPPNSAAAVAAGTT